jgi:ribonuclease HI
MIDVYTDGSTRKNPGPGGWAYLFIWNGKQYENTGYDRATTSNRMEMVAAMEGIAGAYRVTQSANITIHTDSQYLVNGATTTHAWKKNGDLWLQIQELNEIFHVSWVWVRAHNGDNMNEQADKLAKKAAFG